MTEANQTVGGWSPYDIQLTEDKIAEKLFGPQSVDGKDSMNPSILSADIM